MSDGNDVVKLRSGQYEWRLGDLALRTDGPEALRLAMKVLAEAGWVPGSEIGLQVDDFVQMMTSARMLRDQSERIRASGSAAALAPKERPVLRGPWRDPQPQEQAPAAVRRFVKATAEPPPRQAPAPVRRTRVVTETPRQIDIDTQLFEDPEEQLRYELRHRYLMTVPVSQRQQWPWPATYEVMPSFLADIDKQSPHISRAQILTACVDVLSGRSSDVNARKPRPLREGGGDDGRDVVTRYDGAIAWRANISTGTPAARRLMWWVTPASTIVLARVATHNDVAIPER